MSNYIIIILSTGICAFILEAILYSFEAYKSIAPAIKFIYSLCIFYAIIYPVSQIKLDFFNVQNQNKEASTSTYESLPVFDTLLKNELQNKINSEIFNKFGILCNSISIDLNSRQDDNQKNITIKSTAITLSKENETFSKQIKDFLKTIPELKESEISFNISGNNSYEPENQKHNT